MFIILSICSVASHVIVCYTRAFPICIHSLGYNLLHLYCCVLLCMLYDYSIKSKQRGFTDMDTSTLELFNQAWLLLETDGKVDDRNKLTTLIEHNFEYGNDIKTIKEMIA